MDFDFVRGSGAVSGDNCIGSFRKFRVRFDIEFKGLQGDHFAGIVEFFCAAISCLDHPSCAAVSAISFQAAWRAWFISGFANARIPLFVGVKLELLLAVRNLGSFISFGSLGGINFVAWADFVALSAFTGSCRRWR